jgi:hypothetical protein
MKRRTLKAYRKLYADPTALFDGCSVTLFPNGEREIWIKDAADRGYGFRIRASMGPAGLGLQVDRFSLGRPITPAGNETIAEDWKPYAGPDLDNVSLTQYGFDERSQAFKAWYQATPEERIAGGIKHPDMTAAEHIQSREAYLADREA